MSMPFRQRNPSSTCARFLYDRTVHEAEIAGDQLLSPQGAFECLESLLRQTGEIGQGSLAHIIAVAKGLPQKYGGVGPMTLPAEFGCSIRAATVRERTSRMRVMGVSTLNHSN